MKDKAHEMMEEKIQDGVQTKADQAAGKLQQVKEKNQEVVPEVADEATDKIQGALLKTRDKLGKVKEAGEAFQDKINTNDSGSSKKKVKGVQDIKSYRDIKGVSKIKSAADIKKSSEVKGLQHNKSLLTDN